MNCVDYLFENTAELDKLLVLGPRETVSYSHLWKRINILASWLNEKVGENQMIVLSAANSEFFIMAYFGIMKSGNICVPLNPAIEQANLDFIIDKTQASWFFLSRQVSSRISVKGHVMNEVSLAVELDGFSGAECNHQNVDPNRVAQIIFTSGSTALPKGVMVSHGNIIANTQSIIGYLHLTHEDVMAVVLPFFYCYGLSLLHTHVRVGGSLVLNNTFILLGSLINDLKRYKCTGFAGVPSHYQILLRKSDTFRNSDFPDLKYVTQAGGKLHSVFITEFTASFPKVKFYVMYGQTEATARLSYLPPERLSDKLGSIGKGIPGVELKVVNDYGMPTQPGEVGEIIAHGKNVMLGYYQDDEATQKALRDGWLYTGDLAQRDDDGFIYLTARKKEIIKVGGKRISPKEIEEVIVSMPEVIDCSIESVEDEILGEAIKAVVVVNADSNITADDVKRYCATKLAIFKIPGLIEFSDKVEVNSAGKKVKKSS
jgi:acyl-CoA synthetase (AMP-forming)/AMP-acid ligase II